MSTKKTLGGSKWYKYRIVDLHANLRRFQPKTSIYSKKVLSTYLGRYNTVFVKPDNSFGGKDVIRLQKKGNKVHIIYGRKDKFVEGAKLHRWINQVQKGRRFVIQQGIYLMPYDGKNVDLRTIVQRNERKKWEVTGMFAKVAKKRMVITNIKAGGTAFSIQRYLNQLKPQESARTIQLMKNLSVTIGKILSNSVSNRIYGIDLGFDHNGRLWIIEINTKPSLKILKKIDKRMFARSSMVYKYNFKRLPL